jgi:AMMECR1 domain-containing protein
MLQMTIQQNHQRQELKKWEDELHKREMHLIECELKLLMSPNNNNNNNNNTQDRCHQQTPKVQKRSGRFMRSLLHATLNGNASLSSTTASHLISSPTSLFVLFKKKKEV